jgi:hypothetical protein
MKGIPTRGATSAKPPPVRLTLSLAPNSTGSFEIGAHSPRATAANVLDHQANIAKVQDKNSTVHLTVFVNSHRSLIKGKVF